MGCLRRPGGGVPTFLSVWVLPNGPQICVLLAYCCWEWVSPGEPPEGKVRLLWLGARGRGGLAQAGVLSSWLGLLCVAPGAPGLKYQPGAVAAVPYLAWRGQGVGGWRMETDAGWRLMQAQPGAA